MKEFTIGERKIRIVDDPPFLSIRILEHIAQWREIARIGSAYTNLVCGILLQENSNIQSSKQAAISDRIIQVQSDLFAIREELRDTLDEATDGRFIRLCGEIGVLAEDFLPEESNDRVELYKEMIRRGDWKGDEHEPA